MIKFWLSKMLVEAGVALAIVVIAIIVFVIIQKVTK